MNPETLKLLASVAGVLLTVVTGPILWAIRAESRSIRAEVKLEVKTEVGALRTEMVKELGAIRADLKDVEHRLNERIDTRLTHR